MKAQFKRADASGARYALIFGADELARGEVALKAAARRRGRAAHAGRWPTWPPGPPTCATHNPAFTGTADPSMATHLDLEEQEQLDQLKAFWKQYGNLITWVLIVVLGAFAPGTAGTGASATRPSRPARCTTSSTRPRRPATPTRPRASSPT